MVEGLPTARQPTRESVLASQPALVLTKRHLADHAGHDAVPPVMWGKTLLHNAVLWLLSPCHSRAGVLLDPGRAWALRNA